MLYQYVASAVMRDSRTAVMLYTTNRKDFEIPQLTFFTPTNQ
jgi:hypothetical protein